MIRRFASWSGQLLEGSNSVFWTNITPFEPIDEETAEDIKNLDKVVEGMNFTL